MTNLKLPVIVAWIGNHLTQFVTEHAQKGLPVLFFDLHPEIITSAYNFTRIQFPLCQIPYTKYPSDCDYEANQFSKFVWNKVKTNALEAYYLISRLHFDQLTFSQLLRNHVWRGTAYKVACDWLHQNEATWRQWIPEDLTIKPKIHLLGFFPLTGASWIEPGLKEGKIISFDPVKHCMR